MAFQQAVYNCPNHFRVICQWGAHRSAKWGLKPKDWLGDWRRRVDCTTTICHWWGILLRMEELKAERGRKGGESTGTLHRVVGQLRQVIRHWIICCSGWSDKASKQMETRWQRGLLGRSTGGEWWWSQRWGIQVWGQQGEALKADLKRKVWWQQSGLLIDSDLEIYRVHRFD